MLASPLPHISRLLFMIGILLATCSSAGAGAVMPGMCLVMKNAAEIQSKQVAGLLKDLESYAGANILADGPDMVEDVGAGMFDGEQLSAFLNYINSLDDTLASLRIHLDQLAAMDSSMAECDQ